MVRERFTGRSCVADRRLNTKDTGKAVGLRLRLHRHIIQNLPEGQDPRQHWSPLIQAFGGAFPNDDTIYLPSRDLLLEALEKLEPVRQYFYDLTQNEKLFGPDCAERYLNLVSEDEKPDLSQTDMFAALSSVMTRADYELAESMLDHADLSASADWFVQNIRRFRNVKQLKRLHDKAVAENVTQIITLTAKLLTPD